MERPFFYRLSDPRPTECTSDVAMIRQTVVEEIRRILSTRSNGSVNGERNIFNYGIPNVVENYHAVPDLEDLIRQIREAIEAYEPRLSEVRVSFEKSVDWKKQTVLIEANIEIEGEEEKFTLAV